MFYNEIKSIIKDMYINGSIEYIEQKFHPYEFLLNQLVRDKILTLRRERRGKIFRKIDYLIYEPNCNNYEVYKIFKGIY